MHTERAHGAHTKDRTAGRPVGHVRRISNGMGSRATSAQPARCIALAPLRAQRAGRVRHEPTSEDEHTTRHLDRHAYDA